MAGSPSKCELVAKLGRLLVLVDAGNTDLVARGRRGRNRERARCELRPRQAVCILMGEFDRDRISFGDRPLPDWLHKREIRIPPASTRPFDDAEWRGAFVIVEQGEIELETVNGTLHRFVTGNSLWLFGLPLRALHNRGQVPALLLAISRRRTDREETDANQTCRR